MLVIICGTVIIPIIFGRINEVIIVFVIFFVLLILILRHCVTSILIICKMSLRLHFH